MRALSQTHHANFRLLCKQIRQHSLTSANCSAKASENKVFCSLACPIKVYFHVLSMSMSMSMLRVHVHAPWSCPFCMPMSMLHVCAPDACPCPCCMDLNMHHDMDMDMQHEHGYAPLTWAWSLDFGMQHRDGQAECTCPCCMSVSIQHRHGHTVGGLETETLCKKEFKNKKTRYHFNSR